MEWHDLDHIFEPITKSWKIQKIKIKIKIKRKMKTGEEIKECFKKNQELLLFLI
jgi:hypothetical protein